MDSNAVNISFDENTRIRILDSESFEKTQNLAEECTKYVQKMESFDKTVVSLVDVLNKSAEKIEKQKLMAIGLRNKVESETESRKRRQQEIMALKQHKLAELERVTAQLESLHRVKEEQKTMIEKLQKVE